MDYKEFQEKTGRAYALAAAAEQQRALELSTAKSVKKCTMRELFQYAQKANECLETSMFTKPEIVEETYRDIDRDRDY